MANTCAIADASIDLHEYVDRAGTALGRVKKAIYEADQCIESQDPASAEYIANLKFDLQYAMFNLKQAMENVPSHLR